MIKILKNKAFVITVSIALAVIIATTAVLLYVFIPKGVGKNKMEPLLITQSSSSDYTVLLTSNAVAPNEYAAKELVDFIEKATGAKLKIANEGSFGEGKFISIGRTQKLKNSGITFDYTTLNYDGFFIKAVNGNLYIDGDSDRGVLNGIYEFLERYVGIKFLTADATYIPQLSKLKVTEENLVCVPEFRQRNYYNNVPGNNPVFEARSRMYSDFSSDAYMYGLESDWFKGTSTHHSSLEYVPIKEYQAEHPEFYASHHGEIDETYDEICYTNGITDDGKIDANMSISVFTVVMEKLKKFAESNGKAKFFMIGISDTLNSYCKCPRCKASEVRNGTKAGVINIFANNVAREIKKWAAEKYPNGREINVVLFAYLWAEAPPVSIDKNGNIKPFNADVVLEDNVYVRYAPIDSNFAFALNDSRQLKKQRENTIGWGVITTKIMLWDYSTYFTQGYLWYFPSLNYLADSIKFYKDLGVVYIMMQSSYNTAGDWQDMLKAYVARKLFWDVNLDASQLVTEFITYYHGKDAAPFVSQFLSTMEVHFAEMRTIDNINLHCIMPNWEYNKPEYFSAGLFDACFKQLNSGINAIKSSDISGEDKALYLKRMSAPMIIPQYMALYDYDYHYASGKKEMAESFYENAVTAGVTMYREMAGLSEFMTRFKGL